jgi:hypothetical protein
MKFIITEEQQNSLKTKLQKMVKKLGWKKTANVVNGPKNLAQLAFNNDPFDFLNLSSLSFFHFRDEESLQNTSISCVSFTQPKVNNIFILTPIKFFYGFS